MDADKGKFIGLYAVAHFKDGGYQFEFMSKVDIEKRKGRSKAAGSSYSPWTTDYEEMEKKTVVRHMWKYLPISIEVQQQVAYDEGTGRNIKGITPHDNNMFVEAPDYDLLQAPQFDQEHEPAAAESEKSKKQSIHEQPLD